MGERISLAKRVARASFESAQTDISMGFPVTAPLLARMRNAWVAYHAEASWMHPGQSAMVRMAKSNSRLRAEVERLRSGIRDIAEGLRCSGSTRREIVPSRASFAEELDALAREGGEEGVG